MHSPPAILDCRRTHLVLHFTCGGEPFRFVVTMAVHKAFPVVPIRKGNILLPVVLIEYDSCFSPKKTDNLTPPTGSDMV